MNMKNDSKRLILTLVSQIITFVISMAISFFLTPYYVENVGEDAYGFIGLANNFISYIQIITVAINSMAGRFVTVAIHRNQKTEASQYFSSVLYSNILISIPLTIISTVFIYNIEKFINVPNDLLVDVKVLWALIFLGFVVSLIGNVYTISCFSNNRLDFKYKVTAESYVVRAVTIILLLRLFDASIWFYGAAAAFENIYLIIRNVFFTRKMSPDLTFHRKDASFSKIKELLVSGIWSSITKLSAILTNGLDLLIANLMIDASAMGKISIARTLPQCIIVFFALIGHAFMPEITILYAKGEMETAKEKLVSAVKLLTVFSSIPMACIYVFGMNFYSLWVPSQDSTLLYLLTIIGSMEYAVALPLEPLWNMFTVTNKVKLSSLITLITAGLSSTVTIITLNFVSDPTIKMFIIVGVSSFLALVRALTVLPIISANMIGANKKSFYSCILLSVVSTIIATGIGFGIKYLIFENTWIMFFVCCFLTALVSLLFNAFIMLNRAERRQLVIKMKSFFNI